MIAHASKWLAGLALGLSVAVVAIASDFNCRIFREFLPISMGGGYVEFEICCTDQGCMVMWVEDHPVFRPEQGEN